VPVFTSWDRQEQQRSIGLVEAVPRVGPEVTSWSRCRSLQSSHGHRDLPTEAIPARWSRAGAARESAALEEGRRANSHPFWWRPASGSTAPEFRELVRGCRRDIIHRTLPTSRHLRPRVGRPRTRTTCWSPRTMSGPVSTPANLHLAACTTTFKSGATFNDFAEDFVKPRRG